MTVGYVFRVGFKGVVPELHLKVGEMRTLEGETFYLKGNGASRHTRREDPRCI